MDRGLDLSGRTAFVTGGGTGVGAEVARALAGAGATVTIAGRRAGPLKEVAGTHENIRVAVCDVTDPEAVKAAVAAAGPVTIAVANAGAAASKPFAAMNMGDLDEMLRVNLHGTFNLFKAALPSMKSEGWGRMVAIASTAGLKGYQYVSGYTAAKHGVVGLCRSLSLELARTGTTVNAICPGFIETPMLERSVANIVDKTGMDESAARASLMAGNPQKRFIQTDEVAGAVLYLCSEAARSVNGHALPLSGGEI